jgi:hypothetical protein
MREINLVRRWVLAEPNISVNSKDLSQGKRLRVQRGPTGPVVRVFAYDVLNRQFWNSLIHLYYLVCQLLNERVPILLGRSVVWIMHYNASVRAR